MRNETKSKGTWIHRLAIRLFTLVLAVLIFWFLGFLVDDIRSIDGPDYATIEQKHIDKDLLAKHDALEKQVADLTRQIDNQRQKQEIVADSSRNLERTVNQLIELKKLGAQKSGAFSENDQANFSSSMKLFLANQKQYQELSHTISETLERKQRLVWDKEQAQQEIGRKREQAGDEYSKLSQRHRLKIALLQLTVLLPILIIAVVVVVKKRSSIYFPLFLALGAATLVKAALVVHEYFPSRYFKYILIGGLLIVVARLLIYFIRAVDFPKTQWLVRQYREAYERFLCPVCEYPIRIGPRRFLFWNRRTVKKVFPPHADGSDQEEVYICPSCGSSLFEECPVCHKVRHAMLPNCVHCGAHKEIK